MFCKEVPGRTTGEELFRLLDAFMTEARLSWEKCMYTDVAVAMTGRKSAVTAWIKSICGLWLLTVC